MRPSPTISRFQRVALAGQLSLFNPIDPVVQIDGEHLSAIPTPSRGYYAPAPAKSSEAANRKPRTHQSGTRKPPATVGLPPNAKLLVSRKMVAEMLTISIRKVDYMIADGRLLTRRIDNRVLIPIEEIHKLAHTDNRRRKVG